MASAHGGVEGIRGQLQSELRDRVILPGSEEYDRCRGVYFTGVDRRPLAIIRPSTPEEVARAVRTVTGEGARLTIKGGGHGFASRGVADDAVALDLSALDRVSVDPIRWTARAGGGTSTGAFTAAAGRHHLATGFGDSPKVGIGGITQAGGVGFLHRSLGLTIDSLLGAELVTASGEILEVSGDSHPDLWWALRGGGGGFGVVTRLDFRLHPVDRITGGMLMAPATPEVIHQSLECMAEAPPALSGILQAFRAPAAPFIPAELHGTLLLGAYLVHSGSLEEGEVWMERLRALTRPVVDQVGPMAYPALFTGHQEPPPPPLIRWRSAFRPSFTQDEIRRLLELVAEPHDGILRVLQLRPLEGAVADVSSEATAFAHRDAGLLASVGAIIPHAGQVAEHLAWVEEAHRAVTGGKALPAYAGFLGDDDPEGYAHAWPAAHRERLLDIRRRYDPEGVFPAPAAQGAAGIGDPSAG